jgi:spore coat polysaccharide biosynthesis predicted glycosyltransferase SpsG
MQRMNAKNLTLISNSAHDDMFLEPAENKDIAHTPVKKQLWVRTVASPTVGFGHLVRSTVLIRMLSDCLMPVFLVDENDSWTRAKCAENNWDSIPFSTCTRRLSESVPAAVLMDTREAGGLCELISSARALGVPTISIHDLGLNPLPSDIAVDGSIAPGPRADFSPRSEYFRGSEYLVLDPGYSLLHGRRKPIREHISSVAVNLGGGDASRFFQNILQGLKEWGREIEVVGIPGFTDWGQHAICARKWTPVSFRWAGKSESPQNVVFQADLAITAGGLSAFEALCAGTPLLALAYDHHQKSTVARLSKCNACIDLGLGEFLQPSTLRRILDSVDSDSVLRSALSARGRRLIDGGGAERVSNLIRRAVNVIRARDLTVA